MGSTDVLNKNFVSYINKNFGNDGEFKRLKCIAIDSKNLCKSIERIEGKKNPEKEEICWNNFYNLYNYLRNRLRKILLFYYKVENESDSIESEIIDKISFLEKAISNNNIEIFNK